MRNPTAHEFMIRAVASNADRDWLRQGVLLALLSAPSLYIFLTVPPLWRDEDAFNEIAVTFAPRGIIHYLPGYCLGGRLLIVAGSIINNLLTGRGLPDLSINIPLLSNAGIYTLIVAQHLFLIFALFYTVRTLSDRFLMRVLFSVGFAFTPCFYIYANCIGTEAFSNPLVYLIAAAGWNCLRTAKLSRRRVGFYFGLLLAAALTRQINAVLAIGLPIALLPLAGKELIRPGAAENLANGESRFRYRRRFLIFVLVGVAALGSSLLVQEAMCWLFRVPFRSTFGETFSYRLSYLEVLPERERTAILTQIAAKVGDPVVTEALVALNQSLNHDDGWTDMFLYYKVDEILGRSGFNDIQLRTWQTDLKLNRIATCVLFSGEPNFLEVVWTSFVLSPFFAQTDLAYSPFDLTDWLQVQLTKPRYERLRGLASFQHEAGYYKADWNRISYFHLLDRIPMLEMACLTIAFASVLCGLALVGRYRDSTTEAGAWYATGMIALGLLVSFATCVSTYLQARLYLPVYLLFQMGMLLSISLTANVLLERLEGLKTRAKGAVSSLAL
jgi:hypothetical protein